MQHLQDVLEEAKQIKDVWGMKGGGRGGISVGELEGIPRDVPERQQMLYSSQKSLGTEDGRDDGGHS